MAKPLPDDRPPAGPVPEDNVPGHVPDVVPDKPLVPPAAYRLRAVDANDVDEDVVDDVDDVRYPFLFDAVLRPFAYAVGVTPRTAWVDVDLDGGRLTVRFGPWSLATPLDNVAGVEVTGPYRLPFVGGPPHLGWRDRGVTFATSRRTGACIRFHEPVAGLLPFGVRLHPAATVTVTNPHDLARRLSEGR